MKNNKAREILKPMLTVVALAVLVYIFNLITNSVFTTPRNITMLMKQSAVLMILSSTLMMLLVTQNFDLAGGAGVYLTGTVMALLIVKFGWNTYAAIAVGIALGVLMGYVNGIFIGYLGLPAFIVTLAAQQVYRGTGYVLTNCATIGPLPKDFTSIADAFIPSMAAVILAIALTLAFIVFNVVRYRKMGLWYGGVGKLIKNSLTAVLVCLFTCWAFMGYKGIPMAVVIAFVIAVCMHFVASKTVYGRQIYMIGGNNEASKLAGIRTKRRVCQAYMLEGLMYGIAGAVLCARLGGAAATGGELLELDAVAAACIGGTSMSGGVGTIAGVAMGVVIYTMIDNVMSLMNVSSYLQMVVKGSVLLLAVCVDMLGNKAKFNFKLISKKPANTLNTN